MKYIRTKDGRIIDDYHYNRNDKYYHWFTEEEILKQADTIEELCDVLIYKQPNCLPRSYPEKPICYLNDESWFHSFVVNIEYYGYEYHGAIWTEGEHGEPILKSVAKMNKKGELELL